MAKTLIVNTKMDTKSAQKSAQELEGSVDNVDKAASGLVNKLDQMTGGLITSFKSAAAGAKTATAAMFTLRGAVMATGIGALLLTVTSLVSYFTKTQRGADLLSRATKALGAAVDVVVDRFSAFGEIIVSAFQNPQQALKDFSQSIQDFVLRRVEETIKGFTGLGTTIKLIFEGKFSKALETGKEALGNLATGIIPVVGLAKDSQEAIKGVVDEINNETKAAYNLEKAQQALRDREIDFIKVKAQARAEIEKYRLEAEDETKTNEERAAALQKAINVQTEVTNKEIEIEKERARIIRERVALGESMAGDLEEQARAEARIIELESERDRRLRSINTRLNAFTKEQKSATDATKENAKTEEERLKIADEKRKEQLLALNNEMRQIQLEQDELEIERIIEFERRKMEIKLQNEQLTEAQKEEIRLDYAEREKKIRQDVIKTENKFEEEKVKFQKELSQNAAAAIVAVAGEQSKVAKGIAIAQATASTIQGINKALGETTDFTPSQSLRFLNASLVGIAGFANVAKIASINPKTGGGGGGGSASIPRSSGGGQTQVPRVPNIDALNRGVGSGQGGLEPARAYVVNEEIQDKSKLSQKIEDSARLG